MSAEKYAQWLIANQDKKGTQEFEIVATAYKAARGDIIDTATPSGNTKLAPTLSNMDKVKRGAIDPIEGAAQLLYNVLPEGVQKAGNQMNNWIADKTGLVARIPDGGLNQLVKEGEQAYQEQRAAQGEEGLDGWRLMGNVVSPANLVAASHAMKVAPAVSRIAGTTAGKVAAGAVGGAAQGAIAPSYSDEYWADKKQQTAVGGVVGGVLPMAGTLMPKNTAAAKQLKAEGVDVPVGSAMGGFAKSVEDKATSVPFVGDMINSNRMKAIEQFNIATINKALAPIGEKLGKATQAGHDAIEEAANKIGNAYNAILPKLKVQADSQFMNEMGQLKQMAQNLPDAQLNQFNRIIKNEIEDRFTNAGLMSGETFKQVESKLGQLARNYRKSQDYDVRAMGDALRQVQANMRAMLERNNPMYAPKLQKINQAFAMLERPERAASYLGAESGVFTPAQLLNSVKANDPSLRHKAFARGNAMMQEWAEMAKNTLPNKVPDSGTAGRLMLGGGALGGIGMVSPEIGLLGALASAAYAPGGRQVASGLLNASEEAANVIANRAPYAAPLFAPLGNGLLNFSVQPN